MRVHEYIARATEYIADPECKLAARRELQAHLDEAMADALAKGLDAPTAELVATGRMGPPEAVAMDLARAHHRHLPWRHYLALVPGIMLVGVAWLGRSDFGRSGVERWLLLFIAVLLLPSRATLSRWRRALQVDVQAKWQWVLNRHPAQLVPGVAAGAVTGLLMGSWEGWQWSAQSSLGVSGPASLFGIPLLAGVGTLVFLRRQYPDKGPPLLTAGLVSASFAAVLLPVGALFIRWIRDWPLVWGLGSLAFGACALAAGWVAQTLERNAEVPETKAGPPL